MKFKFQKDQKRYLHMHPLILMVMFDALHFAETHNLPFVITSTLTTKEEDEKIGRQHATHRTGRAFDLSIDGWSDDFIRIFKKTFNDKYKDIAAFSASKKQPTLVVADQHGTAPHIHVQIHARYARDFDKKIFTASKKDQSLQH